MTTDAITIGGQRFRVLDRKLVSRPIDETAEGRAERTKKRLPARMVRFTLTTVEEVGKEAA